MTWLAQRLEDLLKERHLSIQRVANDLKIERAYLSQIAHGFRIPSEDLTRNLARYFDENEEEWAFRTRAEPVLDDFKLRYPNMMPKYARKIAEDDETDQPEKFETSSYLAYTARITQVPPQKTPFLPISRIEHEAEMTLRAFAHAIGKDRADIKFPLDAELLVREVFGLDVHYDDEGVLDEMSQTILGCLYTDGSISPWGMDRLIVVNSTRRFQSVTDNFTILHEGGHYVFHHPLDAEVRDEPYCRFNQPDGTVKARVEPREWQASRFASEVLMPKHEVARVLGDRSPPFRVNMYLYAKSLRGHFGVSQAAVEKRLFDLGYECIFGRHAYANPLGTGLV